MSRVSSATVICLLVSSGSFLAHLLVFFWGPSASQCRLGSEFTLVNGMSSLGGISVIGAPTALRRLNVRPGDKAVMESSVSEMKLAVLGVTGHR